MCHARYQHPNAPLTPEGRRRMVGWFLDKGWTVTATAQRFQIDAKTVRKWRNRYLTDGVPASGIGRLGRTAHPTVPPMCYADGCWGCVVSAAGERTILPSRSGWLVLPCRESSTLPGRAASIGVTGQRTLRNRNGINETSLVS